MTTLNAFEECCGQDAEILASNGTKRDFVKLVHGVTSENGSISAWWIPPYGFDSICRSSYCHTQCGTMVQSIDLARRGGCRAEMATEASRTMRQVIPHQILLFLTRFPGQTRLRETPKHRVRPRKYQA